MTFLLVNMRADARAALAVVQASGPSRPQMGNSYLCYVSDTLM